MRRFCLILAFAGLLASGCTVKNPTDNGYLPVWVQDGEASSPVYLGDGEPVLCRISAGHGLGLAQIDRVVWMLYRMGETDELATGNLADDGVMPDLAAADGRFSGQVPVSAFGGAAGSYRLEFRAFDVDGAESDTVSAVLNVLAGAANSAPAIVNHTVFTETVQSGVSLQLAVFAVDADGQDDVDSAWVDLYKPYTSLPDSRLMLLPDAADDRRFTAFWTVPGESGPWMLRYQVRDKAGSLSPAKVGIVNVQSLEGPPVIANVSAPDTVRRSEEPTMLLEVTVTDPGGLADIAAVYFNTYRPDGSASSGNPFAMYDNGQNGDVTAGDGVYSLAITISAANALGDYRFDFMARDRSGLISEAVTHIVKVVE